MLIAGLVLSVICVTIAAQILHMDKGIIGAMMPQAATTAIALPIAESIGGIKAITALAVILNAVLVSALGKTVLDKLHITDPIARGLALGTAGHTVGAAVALQNGETEGAMASLAMVVVSVLTVFVVPILAPIFGL